MYPSKRKLCFIPLCTNTSDNSDKIFICVPKDANRRKAWFESCSYHGKINTSTLHCCEDHFDLEKDAKNWLFYKSMGSSLVLHERVVPHKYINSKSENRCVPSQLTDSAKKRRLETLENLSSFRKRKTFEPIPSTSSQDIQVEEYAAINMFAKMKNEKSIQVDTRDFQKDGVSQTPYFKIESEVRGEVINISSCIKSSRGTSGISTSYHPTTTYSNESSDDDDADLTLRNIHVMSLEKRSEFYLGIPRAFLNTLKVIERNSNIKYLDILIILKKIKTGDQFERLGLDFCLSASYCSKAFDWNVEKLSRFFNKLIYFPDEETYCKYLPEAFRLEHKQVNSIIDCFEIEIQKPSEPMSQFMTWSEYKKCNTMKYLVSYTPYGFINFISKGFGGRTTDKAVVEASTYLEDLPENSLILADRGFKPVGALFLRKKCKLVVPPSVLSNVQSTSTEVLDSKIISALRIHMERVFRRIREFDMLKPHACVHHNLLHNINEVVIIAAGLTNLQNLLVH